jgi:transposase
MKLASLVLEESFSIHESAKKVVIKLSTAKLIIKKYKEKGSFF